jgi:hypothetical protein
MFLIYLVDNGINRGFKGLILGLIILGWSYPAIAQVPQLTQVIPSLPATASSNTLDRGEDVPEEVLRNQIYTEARSPVDGKLLSAAEYIELEEQLKETIANIPPRLLVSEKLQQLIDLLRLRKLIRQVVPFF